MDEREQATNRQNDLDGGRSSIEERAKSARLEYAKQLKMYADFAQSVEQVLRKCLDVADIRVHEITAREKDLDSFEHKAAKPRLDKPDEPKYSDPLTEITDKAAVRVITYILSTVESVCKVIEQEFVIEERSDPSERDPERLGYASKHYLLRHGEKRSELPEFQKYRELVAEVQVRTILQHAWAEIEHDIQYKAAVELPSEVRRGFSALAGTIEIADREFQRLANADRALREQAVAHVNDGRYANVEIRRDSLRAYLVDKFGPDGPDTDISYDWTVRVLLALGFKDLADVDQCIGETDAERVSQVIDGSQQQDHLGLLDSVLLASMGENYLMAHPWADNDQLARGFIATELGRLAKLRAAGVKIGHYSPACYPPVSSHVRDLVANLKRRDNGKRVTGNWDGR